MNATARQRWRLPICSRCGGVLAFPLDGGCTCEQSHAKTGATIAVMPISELEAIAKELERLGFTPEGRGAYANAAEVVREHLEAE